MTRPSPDTPLYNHPLPEIEAWLQEQGCEQHPKQLHRWHLKRPGWEAELAMDIEEIRVRYLGAAPDGQDILRAFPYSLSRQDIEDAIFTGP